MEDNFQKYILNNNYIIIKKIGEGFFASVWISYDIKLKRFVAIKIQNEIHSYESEKEIEFLTLLKGKKYIVEIYDNFKYNHKYTTYYCIVMELFACSVYNIIKRGIEIPDDISFKIIEQLLDANYEITQNNHLLHTDLKPENLLVRGKNDYYQSIIEMFKQNGIIHKISRRGIHDKRVKKIIDNNIHKINKLKFNKNFGFINEEFVKNIDSIVLSDFGTCIDLREDNSFKIQTRYYRSPEILLKTRMTKNCDLWSIGCIYYELITGKILFDPTKNSKYSSNRFHIFDMIRCIGPIPENVLKNSPKKDLFFTNNKIIKGITKIPCDNLLCNNTELTMEQKEIILMLLDYEPLKREDIYRYVEDVAR